MSNTIKLKQYSDMNLEYVAGEAIKPGALVEIQSDGTVDNQDTADDPVAVLIALEDELQGGAITDAYALDDPVQIYPVQEHEEALVLWTGADPAIGSFAQANGDGTLKAIATGTAIFQVIGAPETDSNSDKRVPVRRI